MQKESLSDYDFITDEGYEKGRNDTNWWILLVENYPEERYHYWRRIEIQTHCSPNDLSTPFPSSSVILYPISYHSPHNTGYWYTPYDDFSLLEVLNPQLYHLRNNNHYSSLQENSIYTPFN